MKHHVDNVKAAILDCKKELFLVFCLFLLAFGIRAYLMKYDLFFEFDGYFHSRIIEYVIQSGTYPVNDPLAYYQIGGAPLYTGADFFWYLSATIYHVVTLFAPFNKAAFELLVKVLPALFGSLVVVILYFIGKKLFSDPRAGYLFALFGAVMPAFAYRTMAGWLEPNSFGFLPATIGIYFLICGLKTPKLGKETLLFGALSGLFFAIMAWAWIGYRIIPIILVLFLMIEIILAVISYVRKEEKTNELIMASFGLVVVCLAVFSVINFLTPVSNDWVSTTVSTFANYLPISKTNIDTLSGVQSNVLGSSVGEESKGFPFFFNKYNIFALLIPVAALLLFWSLWKNPKNKALALMAAWMIITFFMGYSKLKYTFVFGLTVAWLMGLLFYHALKWAKKGTSFDQKAILFSVGFLLLTGVAAGSFFVVQNVPTIEQNSGWKETLFWLRDETPQDSKIFNWWDEGHWITYVTERKASLDNRNHSDENNSEVATFIITKDEAVANEIITRYQSNYIVFGDDSLTNQSGLSIYALKSTDTSQPEFLPYLSAQGVSISCEKKINPLNASVTYNCGNNQLSESQMNQLPTTWQERPNQGIYLDSQQRVPAILYRSKDNSTLYLVNQSLNDSEIAKLWFQKTSVATKYTEVYANKHVKVFKVN